MLTPLPEPPEDYQYAEFNREVRAAQLWQLDWPTLGFAYSGVYVIAPRSGWPVKIGISCVATKRLSALQTSHWSKLEIYHFWLCENAKTARKIEKAAHAFLEADSKLMNGEWFDLREHQVPALIEYLADRENIELVTELPNAPKFAEAHKRLAEINQRETRRLETAEQKNTYGRYDMGWHYPW